MSLGYQVGIGTTFTIANNTYVGLTGVYTNNLWDNSNSAWNPTTGIFTAPATASYIFSCTVYIDKNASDLEVHAYKNGAKYLPVSFAFNTTPTDVFQGADGTVTIALNAGDTIQLFIIQVSGQTAHLVTSGSVSTEYTNLTIVQVQVGPEGPTGPTGHGPTGYNTGGTFTSNASFSGTTGTTTPVMAGLGITFTPQTTGKILVAIDGYVSDLAGTTVAGGLVVGMQYGPTGGAAPINQAALTGIALGATFKVETFAAIGAIGEIAFPFHMTRFVAGLIPGTVYWFDLTTLATLAADKFAIANPNSVIVELP